MKRDYIYIAIIVIVVGVIVWSSVSNRGLRYELRDAKRENKELHADNEVLQKGTKVLEDSLAERDKRDSLTIIELTDLKANLIKVKREIIIPHESTNTVIALDLDGDIEYLSRFLGRTQADSVR